jgi:hypothetical protein
MTTPEREQPRTTKRARSRIPKFKTIEEAAEFWDTHSMEEFADELEDVTGQVRFVPYRPKKAITVRLPEDSLATLTKQAHEKGIGPSTLVRMWILDHLREQDTPSRNDPSQ